MLALPVLAIAYVLGLVLNSLGEALLGFVYRLNGETERDDLICVSRASNKDSASLEAQTYRQLRQDKALLAGGAIGVLLAGFGVFFEARNFADGSMQLAICICGVLGVLFSIMVFHMAGVKGRAAHSLAGAIRKQS